MTPVSARREPALRSRAWTSANDVLHVVPEGTAPPVDIPADVLAAASATYLAGERLDMQRLALDLGISRATLYRRAGNRDALLASVLWWHGRRTLVEAVQRTARTRGVDRVIAVTRLVLTVGDQSVPLRRFVAAEPEVAMRVLTGAHGGIQGRYVDCYQRLFDLEAERGHVSFSLDLPSLAYAVVRLAEGFLYADVIGDRERDIGRAEALVAGLLRGLDTTRRPD